LGWVFIISAVQFSMTYVAFGDSGIQFREHTSPCFVPGTVLGKERRNQLIFSRDENSDFKQAGAVTCLQ
jgi:hypothetical protein